MCTAIYNIHNITLWSCPITITCPEETNTTPVQYILENLTHVKINATYPNTTYPNTTYPNTTYATYPNTTYATNPNATNPNATYATNPNATNVNATNDNATNVNTTNDNAVNIGEMHDDGEAPAAPSPSTTYLRRKISPSFSPHNISNTSNVYPCQCSLDILHILHILWAIPLLIIMYRWIRRKCGRNGKIRNLFIPVSTKYLKRSHSWPKISQTRLSPVKSIDSRAASEPSFDTIVF